MTEKDYLKQFEVHSGDLKIFLDERDRAKAVVEKTGDLSLEVGLRNVDHAVQNEIITVDQGTEALRNIKEKEE